MMGAWAVEVETEENAAADGSVGAALVDAGPETVGKVKVLGLTGTGRAIRSGLEKFGCCCLFSLS